MLKHVLVAVAAIGLMFAINASAQGFPTVRVTIDHSFIANGKSLPAGDYSITYDPVLNGFSILGAAKGSDAMAIVESRLSAKEGDLSSLSTRLLFDVVGDKYVLTEIWLPNQAGYVVGTRRLAHTLSAAKAHRS